jgi:hypothetical protein
VPEDVALLNRFWHGQVASRAKTRGGEWNGFLEGGKDAMKLLKR